MRASTRITERLRCYIVGDATLLQDAHTRESDTGVYSARRHAKMRSRRYAEVVMLSLCNQRRRYAWCATCVIITRAIAYSSSFFLLLSPLIFINIWCYFFINIIDYFSHIDTEYIIIDIFYWYYFFFDIDYYIIVYFYIIDYYFPPFSIIIFFLLH